jgi:hypothetical protein
MKQLRILPAVLGDIADAAQWYDCEGHQGLGDRFIDCFYSHLPKIQKAGEGYRMVYRDFRKLLLKPFPYILYYREHKGEWIVTLVFHAARKPETAKSLLNIRR